MRHFKIVMTGYNCFDMIQRSVQSVLDQDYSEYDVCVVDDASTDQRMASFVEKWCNQYGWKYILHTKNTGAMVSQYEAIQKLDPKNDDVIVWVDADDRLAHQKVLSVLNKTYDHKPGSVLMSYGSYEADPPDSGCPKPSRYPNQCASKNDYRNAYKWGLQFNHLRTVSWNLYSRLIPEIDFCDSTGQFFKISADTAIMIPCLEMAAGRYAFIPETLYYYTSDNPLSEWRIANKETLDVHDYIFTKIPRKNPI